MKDYYVYLHKDINDKVFYVGKGKLDRCFSTWNRNEDWWSKSFVNGLMQYRVEKVCENLTQEESLELERLIIEEIGWDNLTNIHPSKSKHNENQRAQKRARMNEYLRIRKDFIKSGRKPYDTHIAKVMGIAQSVVSRYRKQLEIEREPTNFFK